MTPDKTMTGCGGEPDNPPAFPSDTPYERDPAHFFEPGMALRDWFAGQALAGLLAGQWNVAENAVEPQPLSENASSVASGAYAVADAMLAARGQS